MLRITPLLSPALVPALEESKDALAIYTPPFVQNHIGLLSPPGDKSKLE